jgi:hypothetical protein
MDLPENYYAWTWGDAQFIVLDVYRTECRDSLVAKPQGWNWTLGETQYNWLLSTLQNSTSTYKFVFAHHIRGQGRGGITEAPLYEWGGNQNLNGNYTFPIHRPGWPMSIHEMFINYGVNIFFQGHDHLFAHEVLDGVTYQEVPMAADSTYEIGVLANANAYTADTIDGTGHIRVQVNANCVQVDYIKAFLPADTVSGLNHNREVAFSYTIGDCQTPVSAEPKAMNNEISIFPNPANTIVQVLPTQQDETYTILLYNSLGQIIKSSNSNLIQTEDLKNGLYSLRILSGEKSTVKKLIIQH